MTRGVSILVVAVYLIVGAFVAGTHHYFSNVDGLRGIVSALLAILLWPLVLIGVEFRLGGAKAGKNEGLVRAAAAGLLVAAGRRIRFPGARGD